MLLATLSTPFLTALPAQGTPTSRPLSTEDQILLTYLKGAALCLAQAGHNPKEVVNQLYEYLDDNRIPYYEPGTIGDRQTTADAYRLFQRPGFCKGILPRPLFEV